MQCKAVLESIRQSTMSPLDPPTHIGPHIKAYYVWSHTWLIYFNNDKCVALRIHSAISNFCFIQGVYLNEVTEQRYLRVIASNDLKPTKHIQYVAKKTKAYQRIGVFFLKRCFSGFSKQKVHSLYTFLVRPVLEYETTPRSTWTIKDKSKLDKVQKRCPGICSDMITLESLEERRKFTDLVETYRFLSGSYKIDSTLLFKHPNISLQSNALKLQRNFTRTEISKSFFSNRVFDS